MARRPDLRCPQHSQRIVAFCALPPCFLPLCPLCVSDHQLAHAQQRTHLRLVPIQGCLDIAEASIAGLLRNFEGLDASLRDRFELERSEQARQFKQSVLSACEERLDRVLEAFWSGNKARLAPLAESIGRELSRLRYFASQISKGSDCLKVLEQFIREEEVLYERTDLLSARISEALEQTARLPELARNSLAGFEDLLWDLLDRPEPPPRQNNPREPTFFESSAVPLGRPSKIMSEFCSDTRGGQKGLSFEPNDREDLPIRKALSIDVRQEPRQSQGNRLAIKENEDLGERFKQKLTIRASTALLRENEEGREEGSRRGRPLGGSIGPPPLLRKDPLKGRGYRPLFRQLRSDEYD